MHSFILSFEQQMVNPSFIMLKSAKTSKMTLKACYISRNTCNGLKNHQVSAPITLLFILLMVAGYEMHNRHQNIKNGDLRDLVPHILRFMVIILNRLNIFKIVMRMSQPVCFRINNHFIFGHGFKNPFLIQW